MSRKVFGGAAWLLLLLTCACSDAPPSGPELAQGEVAVIRDEWGVPHIYAELEEDGYYGLGYAMAEDQLERFLRTLLFARGTTAAAFGSTPIPGGPGQPPPQMDYQSRLWRIHEVARESVERLDPQLRKNYESYAAGVLDYMEAHAEEVPDWAPRDLTVADMVALPRAGLWLSYQAGIGVNDCRRGGANVDAGIPSSSIGGFSNVWAVMPERTATGGAILLTDPHGGIDGRFSQEYRIHAGRLASTGYAFGPMMIVSRNAHVGWGMTTGSPDVADCFVVETDPDNPRRFLFDGDAREMETAEIVIEVKDTEPITVTAEYTRHNGFLSPVVARDGTRAFVVSTTYMDDAAAFANALYRMNLAANVDELREAMSNNGVFPQNVLAADTNGDILFVHAGKTPVRPDAELDWMQPVDGNTSETAWQGIHPLEELLVIRSPAAGYLQNHNVDPHFMDEPAPEEVATRPGYVLNAGFIEVGRSHSRPLRSLELLTGNDAMTREQAFAKALDTKLAGTESWIELLSGAVVLAPPIEDTTFLDDLLAFDGFLDRESTGALKYVYWREALREGLSPDQFQALADCLWDGASLEEQLAIAMLEAVQKANETMVEVHEKVDVPYGAEFRIGGDEGHSWPQSGGSLLRGPECGLAELMCPTTLWAFIHSPRNDDGQRLAVVGSRIMRLDFYGPEGIDSYSLQNPGHSDVPESGHTEDQAEKLSSAGQLKPVHFDWDALKDHVARDVRLQAR